MNTTDIIITGSGRGIGLELVKIFIEKGWRVLALSRNIEKLVELQKKNQHLFPISIDISKAGFEKQLVQYVETNQFKPIVVINNAGLLAAKPALELTESDFDALFAVNVKAPFFLLKAIYPILQSGSHVVNIGSMGGYQGSVKFSGLSLYSASKGALAVLTECLAEEWSSSGIKVNCLALGAAQTEMLAEAFPGYKAPVSAAEMAGFITEFAINGHHFINGKILPVSVSTP